MSIRLSAQTGTGVVSIAPASFPAKEHGRMIQKLVIAVTALLALMVVVMWSFKLAEWLEEKLSGSVRTQKTGGKSLTYRLGFLK